MSFSIKKINKVIAGISIAGILISSSLFAASKLYVPKSMITGSTLTTGRSFYTSPIPENSLAGIRLGRKAKEILLKWGNPTRITISASAAEAAPAAIPGMEMMPGMGGFMGGPMGMGGIPGMEGVPGMEGMGVPTPAQQPRAASVTNVVWTYDLHNGITIEFVVTEGIITQITVGGVGPWSLSKLRSGLQLGDSYKLVLWVNGYPEKQTYNGRFLRVSYVNKNRAVLTLLDKKIVGVTIAMIPEELKL